MITTSVDLGQLLIIGSLGIIGWFLKRELEHIRTRLARHDRMIFKVAVKLGLADLEDE